MPARPHQCPSPLSPINKFATLLQTGVPIGVFHCQYLGNVPVSENQGDAIVANAVDALKEAIFRTTGGSAKAKRKSSQTMPARAPSNGLHADLTDEDADEGVVNLPSVLVVSSEGIRTVDAQSHELLYNVIIKAVSCGTVSLASHTTIPRHTLSADTCSILLAGAQQWPAAHKRRRVYPDAVPTRYSTEIVGKKVELFAFIEVDDRRNTRTCHVYMCERGSKGQALAICNAVCEAFKVAVAEAKARAGNPLLPMGVVREKVEGPLAACQISRKGLAAIKAIGAGQFGKVYLAIVDGNEDDQRAVKMLRSGAGNADRSEFLREAEVQLELGTHPNIVEFAGVAVQQRPWLVVLEFCQYGDLSDVHVTFANSLPFHFALGSPDEPPPSFSTCARSALGPCC